MKMKNIFKISKRGIIAILILCILLGNAGTCVNVLAMTAETTVATEDTTVVTEENTQELVPMMARSCGDYYSTFHDLLDAYNIDYTGNANHTVLGSGYSYTYTKSGSYWSIYLEGPSGPIGLFHVGMM